MAADTVKADRRKWWGKLTPFDRHYLRSEYRHLRRCGLSRILAAGSMHRTANMLVLASTGI